MDRGEARNSWCTVGLRRKAQRNVPFRRTDLQQPPDGRIPGVELGWHLIEPGNSTFRGAIRGDAKAQRRSVPDFFAPISPQARSSVLPVTFSQILCLTTSWADTVRSKRVSMRGLPECKTQGCPAGTPHLGQRTVDNWRGERDFAFIHPACAAGL